VKISCKSVQPFSRNLSDKETNKDTYIPEHVSGAENGAERAKTRVERSGAVSGCQKNRAERSVSGGTAERERSGERTKSAAPATAPPDILLFSLSSRDTN